MHAHSLYLQVAAAWGLVGLIGLLGVVAASENLASRSGDRYALAFLLVVLLDGLADYVFWFLPTALMLAAQFITLAIPIVGSEVAPRVGGSESLAALPES
jgi:hypothetical protein